MPPGLVQASEPLAPGTVAALASSDSYPGDSSAREPIRHLQTHLSHVFLTGERVYKLRKSVVFDFVDFGSLAARRRDCEEEVRLNRRLSPDVYLGVATLTRKGDGFVVGPVSEPGALGPENGDCEILTVMRRLPEGRDALTLLNQGEVTPARFYDVARQIAHFHRGNHLAVSAATKRGDASGAGATRLFRETLDSLQGSLSGEEERNLKGLDWRIREFESLHGHALVRRVEEGRRVDGHGDLHLQHIWFDDDGQARIIDCLEFREDLRCGDAAADLAFLTMDLRYRGRGDLAEGVVATYAEESDDYELFSVLRYFESYRAIVRAKVAHLASLDPAIVSAQRSAAEVSRARHLALAFRLLDPPETGSLVITSGWVGTGKSTAARRLAESLQGVRVSSDGVRKHLRGLSATDSLKDAWGAGAYTQENKERVYAALLTRASWVVRSGRTAILDATYSSREERRAVLDWARAEGVRPWLVQTTCRDAVTADRLRLRREAQNDASDAGPELLAASRASYEDPVDWPDHRRVCLDTEGREWQARILEISRRIAADRFG